MVFECEFKTSGWTFIEDAYTCAPTVAHTGSEETLDDVKGEHEKGKSNFDVEYLNLYNQRLSRIPKNIEIFFPNLKGIEWHNSNLTEVHAEDLQPFPDLLVFAAFYNKLESVDGDLFKHNPKLQRVYFHSEKIQSVGDGLLSNLNELISVNFESNPCIDTYAATPEQVEEIKSELVTKCPSSETSESAEPSAVYLEQIRTLESKILKFAGQNSQLEKRIMELSAGTYESRTKVGDQGKKITKYEKKFAELEKQISELRSSSAIRKVLSEISDFLYQKIWKLYF